MTVRFVILDTNVVVSGLLTADASAPTAVLLDRALAGALPLLLSPDLLAEYRAVLLRPAIRRRHRLSDGEIDELLTELAWHGAFREPAPAEGAPDAGDSHLWALLAAEPGALLVTGDAKLREARAEVVWSPAEAIARLARAR